MCYKFHLSVILSVCVSLCGTVAPEIVNQFECVFFMESLVYLDGFWLQAFFQNEIVPRGRSGFFILLTFLSQYDKTAWTDDLHIIIFILFFLLFCFTLYPTYSREDRRNLLLRYSRPIYVPLHDEWPQSTLYFVLSPELGK